MKIQTAVYDLKFRRPSVTREEQPPATRGEHPTPDVRTSRTVGFNILGYEEGTCLREPGISVGGCREESDTLPHLNIECSNVGAVCGSLAQLWTYTERWSSRFWPDTVPSANHRRRVAL